MMTRRYVYTVAIGLFGLALSVGLGIAMGQQAPPTELKDVAVPMTVSRDLGPEVDGSPTPDSP
jgi:hypothetical protein